jgi:(S)-2-hydroxyglutarate dehydrogenase
MYDIVIIGGGIVGLATAYRLKIQSPDLKVLLLEKENKLAQHQTGHNSGVIHSGIYYKPNSLKAQNCLEGYKQLLAFCEAHNIPYDLCGKVIVATKPSELQALKNVYERGLANGLAGLKELDAEGIKAHEPHVKGIKGIFVPQTGIVDYTQVSLKYASLFTDLGGEIRTNEKVLAIDNGHQKTEVFTNKTAHLARLVVNCAGLYSDKIASFTEPKLDVRIIPFRGEYFELKPDKQYLVRNLIYPVPDPNFPFLGVHFTRMIGGGIEAGPNAVFAFKKEGYHRTDINFRELWGSLAWQGFRTVMAKYWQIGLGEMYRSFSKSAFTKALQQLVPEVQESDLVAAEAGVRAQACDRTGGLLDDFKIVEAQGAVHVLNAPSPAATSSLAIGNTVAAMAIKRLG